MISMRNINFDVMVRKDDCEVWNFDLIIAISAIKDVFFGFFLT